MLADVAAPGPRRRPDGQGGARVLPAMLWWPVGPLAMIGSEPRQARKGAAVAADSCAGVWLTGPPPSSMFSPSVFPEAAAAARSVRPDRKSTRLNSSHVA